jgi:hypothetical protein
MFERNWFPIRRTDFLSPEREWYFWIPLLSRLNLLSTRYWGMFNRQKWRNLIKQNVIIPETLSKVLHLWPAFGWPRSDSTFRFDKC